LANSNESRAGLMLMLFNFVALVFSFYTFYLFSFYHCQKVHCMVVKITHSDILIRHRLWYYTVTLYGNFLVSFIMFM